MTPAAIDALIGRTRALFARSAAARHVAAASMVALTLVLRALLEPLLNSGVFFHLFYPAVIVSTYMWGIGPGLTALALSAVGGFALFGGQAANPLPLATFLISSTLAVFLIAHIRGRLHSLENECERIEALTRSQASLFREHAGRVSDHLQLISALLQVYATGESRSSLSRALMDSAGRTLLISRMHRAFVAGAADTIDFGEFAVRLSEAVLASRASGGLTVHVECARVELPLERASALGLVMIECITARAASGGGGVLRVSLETQGPRVFFRVVDEGLTQAPSRDMAHLGALAAQMQASLVVASNDAESSLQLAFAKELPPLPHWRPAGHEVH